MKIFLTSIFAQTLVTVYILYRAWYAFAPIKTWRSVLISAIIIEELLFFSAYFFHQRMSSELLSFIQIVCGTWFIASIYLAGFLLIVDFARLINHYFPFYPKWVKTYYDRVKLSLLLFFIFLVSFFLYSGYRSYQHPKVKHQTIHIAKKAGGGMHSLRIAFASDIHSGYVIERSQLRKYVDLINEQHCDMIVLGGDLIDYDLHILNQQGMANELRRLQAPLGVYTILGNHEYRFNTEKKIEWMKKAGLTVLRDSVVMPRFAFYLVGRDDKKNVGRDALGYLLEGLDKSKPIIVANHQPTNLWESVRNGVDFEMMGHVHDGQIWPHNWVMKWYWDGYSKGYRKMGNTQFFITSGLGLSGPPYRIFTDSELLVFDIVFGAEADSLTVQKEQE